MTFNPSTREVTVVLQPIGKTLVGEKPVYRKAGYQFVQYDGDPDRLMEPVNACATVDAIGEGAMYTTPTTVERIVGFEIVEGRMSEVHAFPPDFVDV
jgi:hypothetical protein